MTRRWVVNASPLIVLTKINQVHLLFELCDEVIIPSGVAREICVASDNDPAKLCHCERRVRTYYSLLYPLLHQASSFHLS